MGGKSAGGGFLGIGGESGFLNTGLFGTGPAKIKGFEQSPETRAYEQAMLERQNLIASGQAPNIATDQAMRAAQSTAASGRGIANPMLAQRAAQNLMAEQGLAAQQQERRAAEQMIAQQAASQRGIALQADQANIQNKLTGQGQQAQMISGLGQAGAAAATKSDINSKKDIKPEPMAGDDIEKFVNAIKAYDFKYKEPDSPGAADGEQMGVMAQDLEKSKTGAQAVVDTPNGKMVDYSRLLPAMAAAIAEQNKKIKKLEG